MPFPLSPIVAYKYLSLIDSLDKGEGDDFDTLLSNAAARGHDRDAAEAMLDELSDDGLIHEPRFGWFKPM